VRKKAGVMTEGKLEKLKAITEKEDVTHIPEAGVDVSYNHIEYPSTNIAICYFSGIFISTGAGGAYYRGVETNFADLASRVATPATNYAASAAAPLYCYGCKDGLAIRLIVTPSDTVTTGTQTARYHFVEKPDAVVAGSNFPLDDDLGPVVLDYAMAGVMGQKDDAAAEEMSVYLYQKFLAGIQTILGLAGNTGG
jgi:hypothetical protein